MSSKNDVTGAELVTKAATNKYREGWDRIFGKGPKNPHVWTSCNSGVEVCDQCSRTSSSVTAKEECPGSKGASPGPIAESQEEYEEGIRRTTAADQEARIRRKLAQKTEGRKECKRVEETVAMPKKPLRQFECGCSQQPCGYCERNYSGVVQNRNQGQG